MAYTYDPRVNPPSPQEIEHWERQIAYFAYHEGDQGAPVGSTNATTWGIPEWMTPHEDFWEYLVMHLKREDRAPTTNKLVPQVKYGIFVAALAHSAWLVSQEGAAWVLSMFGIEEIAPFDTAYLYRYRHPDGRRLEVGSHTGRAMRAWRRVPRNIEPPIPSDNHPRTRELYAIAKAARYPFADAGPMPDVNSSVFYWTSSKLRNWFTEEKADPNYPTNKPSRMVGRQWALSLRRPDNPNQPFFRALHEMQKSGERAYRIQEGQHEPFWCGPATATTGGIESIPMVDVAKDRGYGPDQLRALYACQSCNAVRTCVSRPQNGPQLCMHCYGIMVEKDQRPSLDWCTYDECKACTDYIGSAEQLVQIKTRLNRQGSFPVNRVV